MRLVRESEFKRVYAEGSRARGAWLTLVAAPNELGRTRLGLSVGKRYDKRVVLRDVSLSVNRGEVVGLLGPNGAGKTTTLKLLMQLIYPTSGTARIPRLPARRSSASSRPMIRR